jgi:hypothetical protein
MIIQTSFTRFLTNYHCFVKEEEKEQIFFEILQLNYWRQAVIENVKF